MVEVKITVMRTITYLIDDKEGFRKSLTKEQLNLMNDIKGFKVYYTLHEDGWRRYRRCSESTVVVWGTRGLFHHQ